MKKKYMLFCIFMSLLAIKCFASNGYAPLVDGNSGHVSDRSGCCGVGIIDSKTHEKHCAYFSVLSSVGAIQTTALSFGAAYSSSKIVCIGLTASSGCSGCMVCAAVALAARECTLAQVARKQERLQQQKPVNLPGQHTMENFPSVKT